MWLLVHEKMRNDWAEEAHAYHAIRGKLRHRLRHPGRALDLKTKDFIGPDQTLLFISQFRCAICTHCITHFALVLHVLHSFLSQSELSIFFVFIITLLRELQLRELNDDIKFGSKRIHNMLITVAYKGYAAN